MSLNENRFISLTVFIMASNETDLLEETVDRIRKCCDEKDIEKIVVVAKSADCPSYFEAQRISEQYPKLETYVQKAANTVLCVAEMPPMAESSHFVMMAADMEMYPETVSEFVKLAKENPDAIICGAKWLKGSEVLGYGAVHRFFSVNMNRFISLMAGKKVYDPFSIFQICPTSLYRSINYSSPAEFLYEYTLVPLVLGKKYMEIPTVYNKGEKRKSHFGMITLFRVGFSYCMTAVRIRFIPEKKLKEKYLK